MYEDEEFFGAAALGTPRDENAVKPEEVVWLRPHEILHDTQFEEPTLFGDEATDNPGDVEQGRLGDCYLVGAMASVAVHPLDIVDRLFGPEDEDFNETGKVSANFYKDGEWESVTVDTRLPCDSKTRKPVFCKNRDANELWSALLEKAYAKLHGSYSALNGGSVAESLVDLSGGAAEKILLTDDKCKEMVSDGRMWRKLSRFLSFHYLMGASYSDKNAGVESEGKQGILVNHAYSVLMAKEVAGRHLVKVRNPWGQGEWTGDWSDNSELWNEYPEVRTALEADPHADFTLETDGTFWMSFEDFCQAFNKIYVCRVFGPKFKQFKVHGEWKGKTAAGSHKAMRDRDGDGDEKASEKHKGWLYRENGDSRWFNNPQYKVTVKKHTQMFASLLQGDGRLAGRVRSEAPTFDATLVEESEEVEAGGGEKKESVSEEGKEAEGESAESAGPSAQSEAAKPAEGAEGGAAKTKETKAPDPPSPQNHTIRFVVIRKPRNHHTRVWELDESEIVADSDDASFSNQMPQREVTKGSIDLDPRFSYFVIPFTASRDVACSFCLRLFSEDHLDVVPVDETYSLRFKGGFERRGDNRDPTRGDSAGGPLLDRDQTFNAEWCQNPQYILYLPPDRAAPTNIKVVVHRTGILPKSRPGKPVPMLGLVACKNKPVLAQPKRRSKKQPTKRELLSDQPLDGTAILPGRPLPPKTQPNRRLSIDRDEWATIATFDDQETSCMLLKDITAEFAKDGLIISPMLDTKDATCRYSLEFHADLDIEVQELPEGQMQSIAGRWGSKTSGGCHISLEQWAKNPVYKFRLIGQRPDRAKVSVTLSRPSADWKKECLRDPVGSMIGFYITPIDLKHKRLEYQPGVTYMTDFVPMNEVSTPPGFFLEVLPDHQSYAIVPCTYEPGKKGKFSLTVSVSSTNEEEAIDEDDFVSPDIEFELASMKTNSKDSNRSKGK